MGAIARAMTIKMNLKKSLGAAAASLLLGAVAPQGAWATSSVSLTCAGIGAGYSFTGSGTTFNIALADGDTLTAIPYVSTYASYAVFYLYAPGYIEVGRSTYGSLPPRAPGGGPTNSPATVIYTPAPAIVYTVPTGGAGNYAFERPERAELSCTSASAITTRDTQNGFSSEQISGQLASLSNTVSNNVKGVLGGGTGPSVTRNGFFLQSLGLAARRSRGDKPEWNAWIKGDFTDYDGSALNGSQANLVVGIDHQPDPDTVIGGLLSYDTSDFTTNIGGTPGALKADGYTIGVYAGRRMGNGLLIDGMLGYSVLDYSVANGAITGAFDATRISIALGISSKMEMGGMTVEPNAKLIFARETQSAYTDSGPTAIAKQTTTAGRLSLGPTVYLNPNDAGVAPWFSVNAEYDFSSTGILATGSPSFDDQFSLRAGFGVNVPLSRGGLSFAVNAGGLGNDNYSSVGATISYRMSF